MYDKASWLLNVLPMYMGVILTLNYDPFIFTCAPHVYGGDPRVEG